MIQDKGQRITLFIAISLMLLMISLMSMTMGPIEITWADSMAAIFFTASNLPEYVNVIIQEVRLPRTLMAVASGATLALCGTVMQGLFRNPLADPGIIGVSAGASLGAAIAIVLFGGVIQSSIFLMFGTLPFFAFLGGTLATFLIYALGTSATGTSVTMMLLAGVALSSIAGAGLGLLNYFASDEALRDLSLWSMGSLAGASWYGILLAFSCLGLLLFAFHKLAPALNALLLGEAEASHLGIDVQRLKRQLILLTAIGVGVSVSLTGIIGFVGLVVPHICRTLIGPDHRLLIPMTGMMGALLLLLSDMVSRLVAAPLEIPVGIITAAIGAPFFLVLLYQQRGRFA